MTLEPTDDQLRKLENALEQYESWGSTADGDSAMSVDYAGQARAAWAVVRDMVLEEAAKHIVRITGSDNYDAQLALELAQGIRELKGPKP
jgi:hypothetical protein